MLFCGLDIPIVDTDEDMCMSLESLKEADNIDALMYVPLNGKSGNALEIKNYCQEKYIFN